MSNLRYVEFSCYRSGYGDVDNARFTCNIHLEMIWMKNCIQQWMNSHCFYDKNNNPLWIIVCMFKILAIFSEQWKHLSMILFILCATAMTLNAGILYCSSDRLWICVLRKPYWDYYCSTRSNFSSASVSSGNRMDVLF